MRSPWRGSSTKEDSSSFKGCLEDREEQQDVWHSLSSEDLALEDKAQCCGAQQVAMLLCLCVSFGIAAATFSYGPTLILRRLLRLMPAEPGWDWFFGHSALAAISIVLILPIWPPLCLASGLLFGLPMGAFANFLAILSGAVLSILLGRLLFKEPVRQWIREGEFHRVRKFMLVLEDRSSSIQLLVLFRFLWIPMFIRNYGPSTLNVELWKLAVACVPHSIWISIIFASLGSSFKGTAQLLREGKEFSLKAMKWQDISLFVVSLCMSLLLAVYAHKKYTEHTEQESLNPSGGVARKLGAPRAADARL